VEKMIELTSLLLVAFGSGSLIIAFVDYAMKCKKAIETEALQTLPEGTLKKS
jgi:hypothetical protein